MDSKKKTETVLIIRQSRGFIVLSSPNLSSSNVEILWKRNNWSINQSQFQTDAVERPILIKNAHAVRSQRSQIRSSHLLILLEIQINTTYLLKNHGFQSWNISASKVQTRSTQSPRCLVR